MMGSDEHERDELGVLPFDDGLGEQGGRPIRRQWHDGRWFFSVVDVVAALTESPEPRTYWAVLKGRIKDEGFVELLTKCKRLKMRSLDGKMRETDAADTETLLRIVQSVPSPRAEPIKQWLAREGARKLDEVAATLGEDQRRLLLRGDVAAQNTSLNDAGSLHGLVTPRDFAVFHDAGYTGLYAGETARDIAARKGVAKGRILDYMSSEELAANWFRITQADAKLRRLQEEGVTGKTVANETHRAVGREVRGAIERIGGTMPEDLPTPQKSIQELERDEQKRVAGQLQPPLFGAGDPEGDA